MFFVRRILSALTLALAPLGCGQPRAPLPVVDLRATGDTLQLSFLEVPEAASVSENRWALVAPSEQQVAIADFATRKVVSLGSVKSGEYRQPFSLFRFADSLYVGDWGMQRMTVWTLTGKLTHSIAAFAPLRGALPRARDADGQFYLELSPRPGPDGSGNRDSAVIVRTSLDLTRVDTVARLAPLDLAEVVGDAGRRFERRILSGTDHWGVLPDGTLWIARVYHNRVDWMGRGGALVRGEPLPDRVLTVTEADHELFLRRFPEDLRGPAEKLPFAVVKPPFEDAHAAPDGTVWLEKSRAIGDSVRSYQVVNRGGKLLREVRHPGHGHVLALTAAAALVAEPTAQGVRLLQYRIP